MIYIRLWSIFTISLALLLGCTSSQTNSSNQKKKEVGVPIDSLNGVYVFYNGKVSNVSGRNKAPNGYNLGLKHQCVEFVKRYYFEYYQHQMPDSYGHAKDFFNKSLKDGAKNKPRNLLQYTNPSKVQPAVGDLLVFDKTVWNPYGHVAIVSHVWRDKIEIIQQNPGPGARSRVSYKVSQKNGQWKIHNARLLGWLRKG